MFEILFWIFAVYGLWKFITDIIEIKKEKAITKEKLHIVVRVFNKEDLIEELIKEILVMLPEGFLRVEDIGSTDNTYEILLRLKGRYENLEVAKIIN